MPTETQKPVDPVVFDKLHWVAGEVAVYEGRLLFRRDRAIHAIGTVPTVTVDLFQWLEEPDDAESKE